MAPKKPHCHLGGRSLPHFCPQAHAAPGEGPKDVWCHRQMPIGLTGLESPEFLVRIHFQAAELLGSMCKLKPSRVQLLLGTSAGDFLSCKSPVTHSVTHPPTTGPGNKLSREQTAHVPVHCLPPGHVPRLLGNPHSPVALPTGLLSTSDIFSDHQLF